MGMVNEAADVKGPLAVTIGEGTGVLCLAVTTSAKVYVLPSILRGRMCRVTASGGAVDLLQGDSTVDIVYAQASSEAGSPITVTTHAKTGDHFPDGIADQFVFSPSATHFAIIGSASCKLYIRPA